MPASSVAWIDAGSTVVEELREVFLNLELLQQPTADKVTTFSVPLQEVTQVLDHLKNCAPRPYRTLYDLTAVDERLRTRRAGLPPADYSLIYQLFSYERNEYVRVKVPLVGDEPVVPSITGLWPSANWYEREVWDMFGIVFENHPHLTRLLMPPTWSGHPLRKSYPARATEMPAFRLPVAKQQREQESLQFRPEAWGMQRQSEDSDFMYLNLGPHHPGTHGVLRIIVQLDGEEIVDVVPDIGYHHRAAEKMGERQSWHTYIPYTDRVDYLGGVTNNLPYVLAVERLAGIEVPERAKCIRVMLSELYRISSHLVYFGTFAQDLGQMSPVFYMFTDRERLLEVVEAICGERLHPNWFRIGGVAQDLPQGWDQLIRGFLAYLPAKLDEYDKEVLHNRIFRARTIGIGEYTLDEAIEWGVTGQALRSCGLHWDLRKIQPYSGYEHFEFEVPTGRRGDCYDRAVIHVAEMRQSLRIIEQCLRDMPSGPYKSYHPLTTPPLKERTMHDIETLIAHFLNVSWGPVIPPGEAFAAVEGTKGTYSYYAISDGNVMSYRTRIRTPSFAHMQTLPMLCRGRTVADLIAILGAMDFVMGEVDR